MIPVLFPGHAAAGKESHLSSLGTRAQGGIVYSNAVTTVSPTYAREALDGGAAGWLRSTLARPEVRAKFQVGTAAALLTLISRTASACAC